MLRQDRPGRPARWTAAVLVMASMMLALVACSSSKPDTGAATAPTVTGGASGAPAASAAAATAFLQGYESLPTGLGVTTPVRSSPATGKTLVYLQCEAAQCAEAGSAYKNAVAAIGWNLKTLNFQSSNPATFTAALDQALQYRPIAVAFVSTLPYAVWSAEVPKYKAAGVALLPIGAVDATADSTILRTAMGKAFEQTSAQILANWFIADSGGHGHALFWGLPQLPAGLVLQTAFLADVAKDCPACSVKLLTQSLPDVLAGKAPSAIVSAVRAAAGTNYVVLCDGALAAGLTGAMDAAGVTGVKIAAATSGATDQAAVKAGQEAAATPAPIALAVWLEVDAAIRFSEGMPVPAVQEPLQLLTTQSMAATGVAPSDDYPYPADYQQAFKQLWKVR